MDLNRYLIDGDGGDPGDMWWAVNNAYSYDDAMRVDAAARTGDLARVNAVLSDLRRGTTDANYTGSPSTLGNFWQQITTDPLGAPADTLNDQLKKAFKNIFGSPFILLALGIGLFLWLGGLDWLKGRLKK